MGDFGNFRPFPAIPLSRTAPYKAGKAAGNEEFPSGGAESPPNPRETGKSSRNPGRSPRASQVPPKPGIVGNCGPKPPFPGIWGAGKARGRIFGKAPAPPKARLEKPGKGGKKSGKTPQIPAGKLRDGRALLEQLQGFVVPKKIGILGEAPAGRGEVGIFGSWERFPGFAREESQNPGIWGAWRGREAPENPGMGSGLECGTPPKEKGIRDLPKAVPGRGKIPGIPGVGERRGPGILGRGPGI